MMIARLALCALLAGFVSARAEDAPARGKATHVVLVVWDGMRSDFMTEKNSPNLWALAQRGLTFRNHHSVYPTLTTVNAAALATGVFPGSSGPIGNYEYLPGISRTKPARTDGIDMVRAIDQRSGGKFLAVPTIAELVHASGGTTAIAGTKSAPLLFDRKTDARDGNSVTLVEGIALPKSAQRKFEDTLGRYPKTKKLPSVTQDKWSTRALTEVLWKEGVPEFSVLWMGDPDRSEHADSPGSAKALAAIKSVDDNLARVLKALEEKGVRDQSDVLVVSDHGFSTIARQINLESLLAADDFRVVKKGKNAKTSGAIRVIGNGGSVLFYIKDHDAKTNARLVQWLQKKDFTGVIFSRAAVEGSFPLARVHLEKMEGPDVVMAFRWSDQRSSNGTAGMIDANGSSKAKGTHGTLSPFDVHNILIAAGPDFRAGTQSDLPSSNLDVAASIVHLLGLHTENLLDGRILSEAFSDGEPSTSQTLEEATSGKWRQYLRISKVGATEYIDEGSGSALSD
ncbi:MAG: alkaline phosphatase family protein [Chthoniobacterales bacterium]